MLDYTLDNNGNKVFEVKLLPVQRQLRNSKNKIAGIYSGRGVGKTVILSWLIVDSILNGEKSLCFSQSFKSLSQNLFEEVIHRFEEIGITPTYNKGSMTISYGKGKALGFTYCTPDACRGQTDCKNLFCDEIALAPSNLFGIALPCLRGTNIVDPRVRFCSTPRMGCWFNTEVKKHLDIGDWDVYTATMRSNTFLSEEVLKFSEDAITDPLMRRQELYGEIIDSVIENCIIDMDDISKNSSGTGGKIICGIDFSRYGVDSTCFTIRDDYQILEQVKLNKADTQEICSTFRKLDNKWHIDETFEDATGGFNIGFHDTMKESYKNLHEINFGGKPLNPQDSNTRTSMYFNLASAIKNGFYLNDIKYKDTLEELFNTSYIINNAGKRALVPKADIKQILGRSPDSCDSLALTFCEQESQQDKYEIGRKAMLLFR